MPRIARIEKHGHRKSWAPAASTPRPPATLSGRVASIAASITLRTMRRRRSSPGCQCRRTRLPAAAAWIAGRLMRRMLVTALSSWSARPPSPASSIQRLRPASWPMLQVSEDALRSFHRTKIVFASCGAGRRSPRPRGHSACQGFCHDAFWHGEVGLRDEGHGKSGGR